MGYLASPLWMAQLLVGIVLVLQSHYIRPEYFTKEFSLFPAWPRFDYERALQLFELTIGILLAPKFLGLAIALMEPKTRRGCGGALALIASTIVEIIISAALAAVMMLIQSGSVAQILSGRDTGWNPQRRDDGSIPFRSIARRHRAHTALGRPHAVRGGADLALPHRLDVPDHRRTHLLHSAFLGERKPVAWACDAPHRASAHAGGDFAAPCGDPRQCARRGARPDGP